MNLETSEPQARPLGLAGDLGNALVALRDPRLPKRVGIMLFALAVAALLVPSMAMPLAAVGVAASVAAWVGARHGSRTSGELPGGIFHVGESTSNGAQIWLTAEQCRSGMIVSGPAGVRGKALLGLAENALRNDSGMIFVSASGDFAAYANLYAMALKYGRGEDVLVLNFMRSSADVSAAGGRVESNTVNPFATGSAHALTEMVVSLMDDVGGDGAMWRGRAVALFTGVMQALVWKRDAGHVELDAATVRDHLHLARIVDLVNEPDLPGGVRSTVLAYLSSLPGFQREKGSKQSQTTLDQHGYLQMQFTKILGSLADVYGHIFLSRIGPQIDLRDVLANRRILLILLPAIERSAEEVAGLGKVIVSMLRSGALAAAGTGIEDDIASVIGQRRLAAPPFMVVFDDFEHYAVPGMAALARHGRVQNLACVFGCAEVDRMVPNDVKESRAVLGACAYRMEFVPGAGNVGALMHEGSVQIVNLPQVLLDSFHDLRINHTI